MVIQAVKLTDGGYIVNGITFAPLDNLDVLAWIAAGNTPLPADPPPSPSEGETSLVTARAWFAGHPAAVDFIRLSPAEQETQIDAMTTAQLKTLLKYLTIAVVVVVKRELL